MDNTVKRSVVVYFLPFLLALSLLLILSSPARAQKVDRVFDENGKALVMDTYPYILSTYSTGGDGRVVEYYVPLRALSEYYGATVHWQSPSATVELEGKLITLTKDSKKIIVIEDGEKRTVDLPHAVFINTDNRMLVPLYFLTDILGKEATGYVWFGVQLGAKKHEQYQGGYQEDRWIAYIESIAESLPQEEMTKEEAADITTQLAKTDVLHRSLLELINERLPGIFEGLLQSQNRMQMAIYVEDDGTLYPGNYVPTREETQERELALASAYAEYFDKLVAASGGWKDFAYLGAEAWGKAYPLDISSSGDMLKGTFFFNCSQMSGFMPLIFEAEIRVTEGGSVKINSISNARFYLNADSMRKAEPDPELYDKMVLSYRYWNSPYRY